jgi:AcrR family transcriptional regulator
MSSPREQTHLRILQAAHMLLEKGGAGATGLAEVGVAAGVSRQSVYLHFGSRAGLLVALVDHIDRSFGLYDQIARIDAEPDPVRALFLSQDLTARYSPKIHACAMALARAGDDDPDARLAFEERMTLRREGLERIFERIDAAGALAPGWTVREAAQACWALGLPQVYQALVVDCGWPDDTYARWLTSQSQSFVWRP